MPWKTIWNWQQTDWPQFHCDSARLAALEADFLCQSGVFVGTVKHVADDDKTQLTIEIISDEAFNTSDIEGEILNRESLQSSIRRNFGLTTDQRKVPPAEQGISQMMVEMHRNFDVPLTDKLLFHWHELLMNGRRDLKDIGRWRRSEAAMQVVSGPIHEPKVYYEAPPSSAMKHEMTRFIRWFAATAPNGKTPLPVLTRAGIAHLWFVCIHPFEDGNGRIGRAIAEKVISEGLGHATLIALSHVINRGRRHYYDALERNNKLNEITDWLVYFAKTIIEAQTQAQGMVDFLIAKTKFYDRFRGQFNERQDKVIARMLREGPDGFKGGLSAEKYIRITGASRATTTRDLHELTEKGALTRTGSLKSTRYHLAITGSLKSSIHQDAFGL